MKAEIRRSHPPPASGLPGLIAKSVGYEITLLRNETWPTLGAEYGVCHVLGRKRAFSCPMHFDFGRFLDLSKADPKSERKL